MKRCALCIQMLQLLKSRGFMQREELAAELETNVRNISEFRKELEMAGYLIESTTGKFGGYRLLSDSLLPAVKLTDTDIRSIQEVRSYVASHADFLMSKEINRVFDKFLSNACPPEEEQGLYLEDEQYIVSVRIKEMIDQIEMARKQHKVVEICYRTMKDKHAAWVQIHPYEIIYYKGAYYCLAYSLKAKDFRNYKFSEERMKEVRVLKAEFLRERDFDIRRHIGQSGLIKGEACAVELLVYEEAALLISEKRIGLHPQMEWLKEDVLHMQTIFEGKMQALNFIMSLGRQVKVLAPQSLQEEVMRQAQCILDMYKEESK